MTKKKILVIDDLVGMTHLLKRNLEATNRYIVRTENTAAKSVAAAREFLPDLIILDIMMPDASGDEIAARIKEDNRLNHIPIVFLSAIIKKEEVQSSGGHVGGLTILAKPVKLDDLINCIEGKLESPARQTN
jgi:CheY-like chemotaxis protein